MQEELDGDNISGKVKVVKKIIFLLFRFDQSSEKNELLATNGRSMLKYFFVITLYALKEERSSLKIDFFSEV